MTLLQLATLAIRLIAVLCGVAAISSAPQWIVYLQEAGPGEASSSLFAFLAALQLLTCVVLFMFPDPSASLLSIRSAGLKQ